VLDRPRPSIPCTVEHSPPFPTDAQRAALVVRHVNGRERLDDALDACEALIEPVGSKVMEPQMVYFCGKEDGADRNSEELQQRRKILYKLTSELSRAYAALANDMEKAGYSSGRTSSIKARAAHFEHLRESVQLRSNDRLDMKMYEAKMRRLIDMYIVAEHSRKISELEDFSLVELIVKRGVDAVQALPEAIRESEENVAETINANVRDEIVEKQATNPEFFARMSTLLEEIIRFARRPRHRVRRLPDPRCRPDARDTRPNQIHRLSNQPHHAPAKIPLRQPWRRRATRHKRGRRRALQRPRRLEGPSPKRTSR